MFKCESQSQTNAYPDANAVVGGSAEPVSVGGEGQSVDDVTGFEAGEGLALVEVPQHGNSVLATGSAEGTIRGNGNGVDVTAVAVKVCPELAVGQVPDLSVKQNS